MRLTTLLTASLLSLAACADHGGGIALGSNPPSPVNPPDQHLIDPVTGSGGGNTGNSTNGGNTGGNGGGTQNGGGNNGGNPPGSGGNPVPEPTALFLVGSGLAGLVLLRRRKQEAKAS